MDWIQFLVGAFIVVTIAVFLGIGVFILAHFFDLCLSVAKLKKALLEKEAK